LRILFITSTRIGDAVMTTGVLKALVDRYPAAGFTIACGPLAQSLFTAVPRLDRIVVVRKRPLDLHWLDLWREVRGVCWDLVVDLRRSLLSFFLRANARHVLQRDTSSRPRVAIYPAVIGITHPLDPHVYTAEHHRSAALRIIPPGPPVLGLGPVASLPEKTWPEQRFRALVRQLTARGAACEGWRIAAFGGPGDENAAAAVLADVAPESRIVLVGEPDLLVVHEALARCAAFVGNDSGLSHLAAAARVPTLALFGATDPARYAPWGGTALRSPDPCSLASLTAESVADAVSPLLARRARA
jgi:ADP-heptose:LPS heptosyltransferase